ncbi:MAG: N-acetylmuramic acid 6-phosphate etherase [Elusimicrobiota bacterium]
MTLKNPFDFLPTEQVNSLSIHIDRVSTKKALSIMNQANRHAFRAVESQTKNIDRAVDVIVHQLKKGGKLIFIGAGTSGRLGILEAAECPPTFNTPPYLIKAFMAGGNQSVFRSKEGAEDRGRDAIEIIKKNVTKEDVVIGIAASGITPFVRDGLIAANKKSAKTILITCNSSLQFKSPAAITIQLKTGPEIISGSTRLKAGTATKLVLNALTVCSMIRLGKVYGNRMVDLQPKSKKLEARALRLIRELGEVTQQEAEKLMSASNGHAKTAIVMAKLKVNFNQAKLLLKKNDGLLHKVLKK